MLPFVFEDGFGFERYVDYLLDVPMYFVYRDGNYIDASGQSFRDFMAGRLPALPGELPTDRRLGRPHDHRFPRGAPQELPGNARRRRRPVAAALRLAGVMDRAALRQRPRSTPPGTWSRTGPSRSARRCARDVPRLGLETPHRSRSLRDIALEMLEIAREGLHRRARRDACGEDETHHLDALFAIAGGGRTPAEELVEDYRTRWGGRVEPVYTEWAYWSGDQSAAVFSNQPPSTRCVKA